jgi:putative endonuclease
VSRGKVSFTSSRVEASLYGITPAYTSRIADRLAAHNTGRCTHTSDRGSWDIDVVIAFPDEQRALRFERYLNSGSGFAFAKRHFR